MAGTSGKTSGGSLDHSAMYLSLNQHGSMVLDIEGHRLDARFLRATGAIADHFTILKPPPLNIAPANGNVVLSWPGNAPGFTLESKDNLPLPVWDPVTPAPQLLGNWFVVTNAPAAASRFYRLSRP